MRHSDSQRHCEARWLQNNPQLLDRLCVASAQARLAMTETCILDLAERFAPELSISFTLEGRGRRECRVKASPMARLHQRKQAAVTTGAADHPAFPARWL
ncbi:hypothetical protein BRAS3843_740022 [Bradyrhizobium sp. STM 3843]|nr:hypothetical protein BRAS3843_740022 [Bradyrhizobium sp. STM 3843]